MKTSTKLLTSLIISSSLFITGAMAASEDGKNHKGHGFKIERMTKKLDLTDSQTAQIQALIDAKKANMADVAVMSKEAKKAKKAERKAQMLALFEAPDFDEAAVRTKIAERNEKMTERKVSKLSTQHAIYQLLNEEQRAKYLKMIQKKMKKRKNKNK